MSSDTQTIPTQGRGALPYRLPAPAGRVWLGLGWPALGGLAVTVGLSVLTTLAGPGLWVGVPVGVLGAAASLAHAAGRPLAAWVAPSSAHLLRRAHGSDRCVEAPFAGTERPVRVVPGLTKQPIRLVQTGEDEGEPLGVIEHGRGPDRTLVLEVLGTGRFGLLEPTGQDTELARWGAALTGLLTDPAIRTLQWLTHTRPDTRPSMPSRGTCDSIAEELQDDYTDLLHAVRAEAVQHRHLLCLTVRTPDAHRTHRGLRDVARAGVTSLLSADLLARPLDQAELGTLLRLLLDPSLEDGGPRDDPRSWSNLTSRERWTHCQTDDTVHRAFAIGGWPRLELGADWLAPLLHHTPSQGTARTLAVHVHPVAPAAAARRVRATVAKAELDGHDRARLGFTPAASDTLIAQNAAATEAELLAGYQMTDLAAVLTVTAPDLDRLDQACRQLHATATGQHLDLRVLHGQHRHALAGALPLGLHPAGLT